jgi:hypothetical protein
VGVRTFNPTGISIHNYGLQELIRLVLLVPRLNRLDIVTALDSLAFPINEALHCNLDAVPALVAVHGIVASHDGRDFTDTDLLDELL